MGRVKKALRLQCRLAGQKLGIQVPLAFPLELGDIQLVLAILYIEGNAARHRDHFPILWQGMQGKGMLPEHDAPNQGGLVLQGKIQVAGAMPLKAADLSPHLQAL